MTADWKGRLQKWVHDACVLEVSYPKPGNVTVGRAFHDTSAADFLTSAAAIAPVIAAAPGTGVGESIRRAVDVTQQTVGQNTNLGIILLLTPLACVAAEKTLAAGIEDVLTQLTVHDAELTYAAIRQAAPGGLDDADSQDVAAAPTLDLRACMCLAADRDLVAAQYANGFQQVLNFALPRLLETAEWTSHQEWRLAWLAVRLMAEYGDSLIRRKCGPDAERAVRERAASVLATGWPLSPGTDSVYAEFDTHLRDRDHRMNPGTTADVIAATIFAALREGDCRMTSDHRIEFSNEP